jgi:hypothetical protein
MAAHIPFVTGPESIKLATECYSDSEFYHVQLEKIGTSRIHNTSMKLWLDPGICGLDDLDSRLPRQDRPNSWYNFMQAFSGFSQIGQATFWVKPDMVVVQKFVTELLNRAVQFKPDWLTIPQLPIANDSSRNKINIAFAKATSHWKRQSSYCGKLILPLIFTHQDQLNGKTERNPKIKMAGRCYHEAQSDGFWVVDKSLTDDNGSKTLRNSRFPGIVDLHTELNEAISSSIRIAGPYWGLNLVLWARGLVDYPAIGIGNSYQYYLAGCIISKPSVYLAIPPLRRCAGVARLDQWLDESIRIIGPSHPAYLELAKMRRHLDILNASSRDQVAMFYKHWFNLIDSKPQAGRAIALFQDLSTAYALGKSLPDFDKSEQTAKRPESVVEPLMLNCL